MYDKPVSLIAMDMDGTLLDSRQRLTPGNLAALRKAQAAGIHLAICSGRTLALLQNVLAQVPQIRYAVVSNGAAAADTATGERLFCRPARLCHPVAQWSLLPETMYGGRVFQPSS